MLGTVCLLVAVDGKRSSGLVAVWLARNRFVVLDKTHQVCVCVSVHGLLGN